MLNRKNLIILIPAALLIILGLVLSVFNMIRLDEISKRQQETKDLVLNESSQNRETDDYFNNISGMIAHDLNRTRASLGLQTGNYPFRNLADENTGSETPVKDNEMINAVSALLQADEMNRKSAMIGRFFRSSSIRDVLELTGAEYRKDAADHFIISTDGLDVVHVRAVSDTGIKLTGFDGVELDINSASNEAAVFIGNKYDDLLAVEKELADFRKNLAMLGNDPDLLSAAGGNIKIESGEDGLDIYNTINSNRKTASAENDGSEVFYRVSSLPGRIYGLEDLKAALTNEINNFDLRTDEEVMIDNAKSEIERKLSNPDFLGYLESMDLNVSSEPREDLDYFYYDVTRNDGSRLGSFSILKKLGDIYLVDADEVPVSSLKTLSLKKTISSGPGSRLVIPENIPQIDSLYSKKDSVTFLLVGNHEKNTDTMILVHADKTTGKAYMIGIPRDLYWKGRKINSIYLNYGPEQFKKELSDITGLDITNYIIVDMYAFIDIVNILGGIEVTLEEDLVDPTYRIRENGEWGTLNYKKGTYKLNGVEALRVARSRHGSNDFERSKRQQQILEAFLNRILELKLTDVDKVYGMMQAIFEYVDTDFSLVELMSLFNNYSNVELAGKHVLSFDNILYDTYSNTYLLGDDVEIDDDFNKGAWILLPLDNNWNNIRWYIRGIINGEI